VNSPVIGSLLSSLRELQATLVRVKQLAALQQIYVRAVPRDLAGRSRVAFERSGTVVVVTDTSAVAAKLKQLTPRIIAEIVKSAPEVTSIHVEVQVARSSDARPRSRPVIGPRGLTSLSELRDALPASPLRQALRQLLERKAQSNGQDQPLQHEEGKDDQQQDQRVFQGLPPEAQPASILGSEVSDQRSPDHD
jgi:hypothetical protein